MRGLIWKIWASGGFVALLAMLSWTRAPAPGPAPQAASAASSAPVSAPVGGAPTPARAATAGSASGASQTATGASASGGYALIEGTRYRPTVADPALGQDGYQIFGSVAVGDVNGDGRDDLVATTEDGTIQVFKQKTEGGLSFPPQVWAYPNGGVLQPNMAMLIDLNRDGAKDIVSPRPYVHGEPSGVLEVLLSDGHGGFAKRQLQGLSPESGIGYVMDIDQDGIEDIVGLVNRPGAAGDCGRPAGDLCRWLRTMYGDGNGGVRAIDHRVLGEPLIVVVQALDFDGDGRRDLIYRETAIAPGTRGLFWRRQLPQGGLGTAVRLGELPVWPSINVAVGDFNGDRRLDFATGSRQAGGSTLSLRLPSGGFAAPQPYPAHEVESHMLVADFDGDGRDDIVSVQHPPEAPDNVDVLAYQLQRDGGLSAPQYNGQSHALTQMRGGEDLAHGDFNGDGCLDVAVAANYEGLAIYYGSGCGRAQMSSQDCRIEQSTVVQGAGAQSATLDAAAATRAESPAPQAQAREWAHAQVRARTRGQAQGSRTAAY